MARSRRVRGIDATMKNLNAMVNRVEGRTVAGLLAGGMVIERQSNKDVPVEYGNLRGSSYTRQNPGSTRKKPLVEVGYTASYAVFVHENMEQKLKGKPRRSGLGVYWGPHGKPKFLQGAGEEKSTEVVQIIKKYAKGGLKK